MNTVPEKRKAEIEALATLDEAAVDTSDLPENTDWSKGVRGHFYRPTKQSVTNRLDAGCGRVVQGLGQQGPVS